jgi:hypothetical protein
MKPLELAPSRKGCCRKIAIVLIDLFDQFSISANAWSIKGNVKNIFSLRRMRRFISRHPAPLTREDARPVSCPWVIPSQQLHLRQWRRRRSVSKLNKPCGCTVSTMGLSEAPGLVLFRVIRGGIGVTQRLGAIGTVPSTGDCHTHPRTRASQEPTGTTKEESPEMEGLFTRDAQAACDFSFSASKFSPFFHRVSVMAAILRASVRRAMVGFMPLASAAW